MGYQFNGIEEVIEDVLVLLDSLRRRSGHTLPIKSQSELDQSIRKLTEAMRETESNGHQIISDTRTVWVNGLSGESVGRLSRFGARAVVDIHQPISKQRETGKECLDCRYDLIGQEAWNYFVESIKENFGVEVSDVHRPAWAIRA